MTLLWMTSYGVHTVSEVLYILEDDTLVDAILLITVHNPFLCTISDEEELPIVEDDVLVNANTMRWYCTLNTLRKKAEHRQIFCCSWRPK
jgi:CBS domain-containing protein